MILLEYMNARNTNRDGNESAEIQMSLDYTDVSAMGMPVMEFWNAGNSETC